MSVRSWPVSGIVAMWLGTAVAVGLWFGGTRSSQPHIRTGPPLHSADTVASIALALLETYPPLASPGLRPVLLESLLARVALLDAPNGDRMAGAWELNRHLAGSPQDSLRRYGEFMPLLSLAPTAGVLVRAMSEAAGDALRDTIVRAVLILLVLASAGVTLYWLAERHTARAAA